MSLDPRFDTRRHKVIESAVSRTIENDKPLKLVRVDTQKKVLKSYINFAWHIEQDLEMLLYQNS